MPNHNKKISHDTFHIEREGEGRERERERWRRRCTAMIVMIRGFLKSIEKVNE